MTTEDCGVVYGELMIDVTDFWTVYGECENFAVLKGHTGAVMELHFSTDGSYVEHLHSEHLHCARNERWRKK